MLLKYPRIAIFRIQSKAIQCWMLTKAIPYGLASKEQYSDTVFGSQDMASVLQATNVLAVMNPLIVIGLYYR